MLYFAEYILVNYLVNCHPMNLTLVDSSQNNLEVQCVFYFVIFVQVVCKHICNLSICLSFYCVFVCLYFICLHVLCFLFLFVYVCVCLVLFLVLMFYFVFLPLNYFFYFCVVFVVLFFCFYFFSWQVKFLKNNAMTIRSITQEPSDRTKMIEQQ